MAAAVAGAFPALLLAVRAHAAGQAGASWSAPAESGTLALDPSTVPTATLATTTATPGSDTAAATLTGAGSGAATGEIFPESGTELPLADATDVTDLLNALAQPATSAANMAVPPPGQALLAPPAAASAPVPTPASGSVQPAAVPPGTEVTGSAAAGLTDATQDQAQGAAAWHEADDARTALTDSVGAGDGATPAATPHGPGQRGMELALPAEFRARLDALLNAAQRPALAADGGNTAVGPGLTAANAGPLNAPTSAIAGGSESPFEALPILEPMSDRQSFAQGLGERLLLLADKGLQSATLKLQPEHLGPMEIRIQVDEDGSAQVLFSAHHAQTRDALEGAIPRLRELFADQGLSLMQANVDSGRSAFAQRGFAGLPGQETWGRASPDENTPPAQMAWRLARRSEHRLDVLV